MNNWGKFSKTTLPGKQDFHSHLNMEDVTDADYMHAKVVCRDFEIKNLGEYHDLHVESEKLLLANVFENFRNICLKVYQLYRPKFLSATGLAWQASLKKTKVKLVLLTDIDMLLMAEKGMTGEACHSLYPYTSTQKHIHIKANNKYMKDYHTNKESSHIKYWNVNNLFYMVG